MAVGKGNRQSVIKNTAPAAWTVASWLKSESPATPSMTGADLLLVHVVFGNNIAVSGITHNGNALTKIGHNYFSGLGQREEFWYMLAPDSGSQDIVVTLNSAMFNGMSICAMGFTNATGIGLHAFNGANPTEHARTRTVSDGSMVYVTGISTVSHDDITIDGVQILPANLKPNQANVNDVVSGAISNSAHSAGTISTETDATIGGSITNSYVEIVDGNGGGGGSRRRLIII